ncbi:MAG: CBS domain-containing protein [Candidatus Eisenbacteria bacterium]|nr:CBS domain-containing protein [Candidatus Eisenbacteria bacterium]
MELQTDFSGVERRKFMRALLADVRALERMMAEGMIEDGVRRVGAEQEVFLVNKAWHVAPAADDILPLLSDDHYTTEFGIFNLEFNMDPLVFGGDCLSRMESQINELLLKLRVAAAKKDVEILMVGILPTIRKSDLGEENMTPRARYHALNRALTALRGGTYEFYIKGVDELLLKHDSAMLEACNTSFQVHFQAGAKEFANLYNIAQVAAGPVLAAATNSPLLFGKRLWAETRIALFQQAVDTRSSGHHMRERKSRVTFGNDWLRGSAAEIFKEDIASFRALVGIEQDEDPFEILKRGGVPELNALRLFNGTVYRWNRPCYGIIDGKPHLRIENRVLPAGPTVVDEVANAAFWFGVISGLSDQYDDITQVIDFEAASMNFMSAARIGLSAQFHWLEGKEAPAQTLILDTLLPMAHAALIRREVKAADVDRYLGIIEHRVRTGRTGSRWMITSLAGLKDKGTPGERLNALTAASIARQKEGLPVAEWKPADLSEAGGWQHNYAVVEQYMVTEIYTVQPDEPIDLVANLMEWQRIRHVPVEDQEHHLIGIVSYRAVLRALAHGHHSLDGMPLAVADIMKKNPLSVAPDTPTLDAIALMRQHQIGALPVVHNGRLIGIITEHDFLDIAAELLEQKLREHA